MFHQNKKCGKVFTMVDYCNLEYQIVDLNWQHRQHAADPHKCDISKRTFDFSNKELLVVLIVLGLFVTQIGCDDTETFHKNIPARLIWAAPGRDVDLPCDLSANSRDSVKLVLWFKDTTGIPLYSLDARSGTSLKQATHSALAGDLGERLYFSVADVPKESKLKIKEVKLSDGGVYRCRVDFFNSPTRNYRVNLTLVESPEEPRIFDAQGKEVAAVAGPFREGLELFLSCQVNGGRPPPKVTWWRDNEEITGVSHASTGEGVSAMINQLFVGTVTRDMFGAKLECRAQSSKLLPAVAKEVTVQVYLKPIKVKIVTPNELLTAGKPTPVRCETWGSYPPAKVVWMLDGEPIRNADVTVNSDGTDGNITSTILMLRVSAENDGAELICRSSNPWFSNGSVEDRRRINVAYPPTVSVHLANEDPSRMVVRAEGQNVTLKCRADARPAVTSYGWYKNGMRMTGENTELLHMTQLERETGGSYSCSASNSEGETRSTSIQLKVQFAPRCKPGTEQMSVGALNMHSLQVKCEVEADPVDTVRFSWTYNNTRNVSPVLNSRVNSHGLISSMTYLPQSDAELVTLACWASNVVGRQAVPCLVHILPAKVPETPRYCEVHNETSLEVICTAGNDGGLSQFFLLEVVGMNGGPSLYFNIDSTSSTHEIVNNEISTMNDQATLAPLLRLQENVPQFKLPTLEPGRDYQLLVYAVNAKGRSDPPYIIDRVRVGSHASPYDETEDPTPAETSNQKNKKVFVQQEQYSQLIVLAALIAAAGVIITSIIVAGCVTVCRLRRPKPPEPDEIRKKIRPARKDVPSMYCAEDESIDENDTIYIRAPTDLRASSIRSTRYVSEGFVQYSQPSLNDGDYILEVARWKMRFLDWNKDPDLILPRENFEFTTLGGA